MKKATQGLVAVALMYSACATADFKVTPKQAPPPAPAAPATAPVGFVSVDAPAPGAPAVSSAPTSAGFGLVAVTFVGTPGGPIEPREGLGRDIRLADALKQIAPPGWRGFVKPELVDRFDRDKRVSWRGGRRWVDVLDILASEHQLAIEVDWQRKHLYVGERVFRSAPSVPVAQKAPEWMAQKGSTLRKTVDEWAKRANWTSVWPMEDLDYPIVAPLSFQGSIVDALTKLAHLYQYAERPVHADIRPGQSLVVFSESKRTSP